MTVKSPQETLGILTRLWNKLRLAWRLFLDPRVSIWPKIVILGATLVYLFSPMDFLPDLVPFVGQLDDLTLIALGLQTFISVCPKPIAAEHIAQILGPRVSSPSPVGDVVEGEYTVKKD